MSLRESAAITAIAITIVFFNANCKNGKHFSQKLKNGPSIALYYETGDIIIQSERKNYGRHDTSVTLNKRFAKKIPDEFRQELQKTVLDGFSKSLPGAAIEEMDAIPMLVLRTINGKISRPDYSALKKDIIIIWRFDVYYRCGQTYYMDRCGGKITVRLCMKDSMGKTFCDDTTVAQKTLYYINPEKEKIEETAELAELLKGNMPDAIKAFVKNFE